MAKIGEFVRTDDFKNEKHVPVIELPAGIQAGEPFEVRVTVGKEIPHPNATEHHIQWSELYFKAEGDPNIYELGRATFAAHGASTKGANEGPAYTNPSACFNVKLGKAGQLIAIEHCNIHGLWEGTAEIKL